MVDPVVARTDQTLSSAQSKDRVVPPSPRPLSSHERTVPEATVPSASSSYSQGSDTGYNAVHYHHHYHYYQPLPVGQVRGGNGSSSDKSSPMVSKPFDHVTIAIITNIL